jgi:hypothetical protein
MCHVAGFTDQVLCVTDIWESAADFETFSRDRLMPSVKELGIPGEPRVQLLPVHAIFAPPYD